MLTAEKWALAFTLAREDNRVWWSPMSLGTYSVHRFFKELVLPTKRDVSKLMMR